MESRVHTLIRKACALLAFLAVSACSGSDGPEGPLVLMGDSIAAQWDADAFFPALSPVNLGIPGAGVESLGRFAGTRAGDTVILIVGTNDISFLSDDLLDAYAESYAGYVEALGAKKVLLLSVLPRCAVPSDGHDVNPLIRRLNEAVKERCASLRPVIYIDAWPAFMHEGKPMAHLYNDRLHLSPDGYEVLAALVRPYL